MKSAEELRATFNARRQHDLNTEHAWSTFASRVQLGGVTDYCCDQAKTQSGIIVPRVGRPGLPFAGCQAKWCSCRWDHLTDD